MMPAEISFIIQEVNGNDYSYEVTIEEGHYQSWTDPKTKKEIFIVGQWLGSFINGKIVNNLSKEVRSND